MAKRKKRKALLPKRIAGVKVPKSVRKGRLGELLASQTGQALLAEAVLAAGAIGAAKKVGGGGAAGTPSVRSFASGVAGRLATGHDGGRDAAAAGAALARAFGEAARAFVNSLNDHANPQEAPHAVEAEWRARDDEDSKKSRASRRPHPAERKFRRARGQAARRRSFRQAGRLRRPQPCALRPLAWPARRHRRAEGWAQPRVPRGDPGERHPAGMSNR